jgi:hypothetical protein
MGTVIASAGSSTLATSLFTLIDVLVAAITTIVVGIINYRQTLSGQLTDQLAMAVQQFGSNNPQVRIGAIFALEEIAADPGNRLPADEHQSPCCSPIIALYSGRG